MIFRKHDNKVPEPQATARESVQEAPTSSHQEEMAPPAMQAKEAGTASVLTAEVVMEGNLVTSGELYLDGTIHGAVQAARVNINASGAISGQVIANEVIIHGRVIGPICGERVHLMPGSQVEGDVISQKIVVEDGAFIDGQIRHSEDPLGEWQQAWYGEEEMQEQPAAVHDEAMEAAPASPLADTGSDTVSDMDEPAGEEENPAQGPAPYLKPVDTPPVEPAATLEPEADKTTANNDADENSANDRNA